MRVEKLIGSIITGAAPDDETSRRLAELDGRTHDKVAKAGLAKPRKGGGRAQLGAFIDHFVATSTSAKPNTLENMKQVRRWLVEFFGENRDIRTIVAGDAEDWSAFMAKGGLGANTIRRHVGRARQLFQISHSSSRVPRGESIRGHGGNGAGRQVATVLRVA